LRKDHGFCAKVDRGHGGETSGGETYEKSQCFEVSSHFATTG